MGGISIKKQRERLITLHHARGVGWKTIHKMWQFDPSFKSVFTMNQKELVYNFQIREPFAPIIYSDLFNLDYKQLQEYYTKNETQILTIFDPDYPPLLKEIYDPPWVLYYKGKLQLLHSNQTISVVGTRDPSSYGINCMNKILPTIIKKDWTIVSGLAYGIDIYSHRLAMENGGKTIAVLGSGLENIYPTNHKAIADEISRHHLLLSEYPNNQKPRRWQFPERNRIISGISRGTLVVEAKERSGSFITADQALNQGRDVFAIPGSIMEPRSHGTNQLIQMGAKLVMGAEDILEEYYY